MKIKTIVGRDGQIGKIYYRKHQCVREGREEKETNEAQIKKKYEKIEKKKGRT